ncbi:CHAT domain-containing protein [Catenulispora sp. EB89]|uniref:CHAT domain-containing protein n=1 Tax=Catenulispora sp. EB89 TaxID=3156257 RepID=UPI003518F19A
MVDIARRTVLATAENHPDRAKHLANLGLTLRIMAEHLGNAQILAEAVDVERLALAATAEDHPDYAGRSANLAIALWSLSERTGDAGLAAEATEAARRAVHATPEDDPTRAVRLISLCIALTTLFDRTGNPETLAEAIGGYRSASQSTAAPATVRVYAFRQLAMLAGSGAVGIAEAFAAVESAVALLPQISPRTLARGDRESELSVLGSLADVAAEVALNAGDPRRAVELLEATRGMLVADTLGARGGEVARLRERHPELARELEELRDRRDALEHSPAGFLATEPDLSVGTSESRRAAQAEWDDLLSRIRAADGFAGFLAPASIADLTIEARADQGPIVLLTAGWTRCDALILTGDAVDPVRTVSLDRLTREDVNTRIQQLQQASYTATDRDLSPESGLTGRQRVLEVLAWLWDTVAEPVLTALGHTGAPAEGQEWPRIWWCPVGPLSWLPLHAAGHHEDLTDTETDTHGDVDTDTDGEAKAKPDHAIRSAPRSVLDRVVSSYTPTIRALTHARSYHLPAAANATLVIAVPDAPGASRLPGVEAEAAAVTALIPAALRPEHPTRAQVLDALPSHPVAHFACHGQPDRNDPAASRLILPDHETRALTVADITALRLTGTLAYLSACATSATSPELTDEAVHLTGAFHLAGYQNVIGTLWPVDDDVATGVAIGFYTDITHGGTTPPDTDASAVALHRVVRALRASAPGAPVHWAAHTHTGI